MTYLDAVYSSACNNCVYTQIQRTSGLWYSAEYSTFSVSDEVGKYRLTVAEYSDPTSDTKMSYY